MYSCHIETDPRRLRSLMRWTTLATAWTGLTCWLNSQTAGELILRTYSTPVWTWFHRHNWNWL